jgi:hypothetical protein
MRWPRSPSTRLSHDYAAEKILFEHALFGSEPYIAQISVGAVGHRDVLRSMELFGTEVAPVVRAEVARRRGTSSSSAQSPEKPTGPLPGG